jgi:mono/diheme cytochrome c family protein
MSRALVRTLLLSALAAATLGACGGQSLELDEEHQADSRLQEGAQLFAERCGGCHTLESAGTRGSAFQVHDRERVDGPNFNTRPQTVEATLYAIRNGGFSGAIMPENIVVGDEARKVAEYLAEYAGRDAEEPVAPNRPTSDDR